MERAGVLLAYLLSGMGLFGLVIVGIFLICFFSLPILILILSVFSL